ncbi:MAG TPA: hypothetical protein VLA93_13215 [Pyrinomonadaceae bacterium]|nr:hypothetical protein [Pyrinomonadaceae bacterium]
MTEHVASGEVPHCLTTTEKSKDQSTPLAMAIVLRVECTRFGPALQNRLTLLVLSRNSKLMLSVVLAATSAYFSDSVGSELAARGAPLDAANISQRPYLRDESQEARSGNPIISGWYADPDVNLGHRDGTSSIIEDH